jgi:hypothetical protein
MNVVLENMLVALIVVASALFSAWRLMSAGQRLKTLEFLGSLAGARIDARLAPVRARILGKLSQGCAGCSSASTQAAAKPKS